MKRHLKAEVAISLKAGKHKKEIQADLTGYDLKKKMTVGYHAAKKDLNSKILHITMTISHQYPELSEYISEIPLTIPIEKFPEITLKELRAYHKSLNAILRKYILEHPANEG